MNSSTWMIVALLFIGATASAEEKKCLLQRLGELPVTMEGTQPLISGTINAKPARFLADSGAFFSMLSSASAENFGLKLQPMPDNFRVVGTGGTARVHRAKVAQFTLTGLAGGHVYEKVDFLVVGNSFGSHVDGLIGQNVFGIADTEYDLANGFLRFFRSKDCKGTTLAYWAAGQLVGELTHEPTTILQPHLIVRGKLNGKTIRVMLDSGASTSVLTLRAASRAGIEPEDDDVMAAGLSSGIGKRANENSLARFDSLDLGGELIKNARLRMADIDMGDGVDMLLGADFFLSHRIYVDSRARKIYFTYNGGPVFDLRRRETPPADPSTLDANALAAVSADTSTSDSLSLGEAQGGSALHQTEATQGAALDAASLRRRGAASAGRKDFQSAITDYDRAIKLDSTDPENFYQRGMAYWDTARPELALADFDKALALRPDYVEALMARGSLRLRHDNEAGARADFEVVQRMAPDNPGLLREMANAFVYAGNIDEGIARLDAWVEKHPKDMGLPMVLNDRCWLRATSNRELNLALADCDAALKKGARNSAVYDSRGFVHLRLGNYDKAIDDYKTAVKLQPRQATSLYGLGLARLKQGLTDLGNRDIATAIAINPNASDVYAKAGLTP